jgi:hypothetical protein
MAAFDVEKAARQGRSETIPATWTKFPASRGAIWSNFLIYLVGALLIFGLDIFIVITGSLPGGTNGDQGLAPLEFVTLLIFGFIFLFVGFRMIPPLIKSDQYFFLITTDGFVYVADKKLAGLSFAEMRSVYRQPGLFGGKLVVQRRSGKSLALSIGRFYATRTARAMEEALTAGIKSIEQNKREKRT